MGIFKSARKITCFTVIDLVARVFPAEKVQSFLNSPSVGLGILEHDLILNDMYLNAK